MEKHLIEISIPEKFRAIRRLIFGLDYGKMLMVEAKLKVQNVDNINKTDDVEFFL